jgi:hypothetical protein
MNIKVSAGPDAVLSDGYIVRSFPWGGGVYRALQDDRVPKNHWINSLLLYVQNLKE